MRTNSLLTAFFVTAIAGAALVAQTPQTQPPAPPPAASAQPPVTVPYKPDFELPKVEGLPKNDATTLADGYVIGAQDQLSIIVSEETELTGKYRVDSDGAITMNYLNRVPLGGLSLADAQDRLTALLRAFLKNPQVRIEVDQFKARTVMVMGEVRTPGKITLQGTSMSLLEALAQAGSPNQQASNDVLVMHPPKPGEPAPEPITVNRKDLEMGRVGRDITLQDGDIVNVPIAKRFYISGFVKNPGSLVLDTGMTMGQAIVLAGGLSDRGSDRRLSVIRTVNGKVVEVAVKMEDKVLPNDEIKVKSRFF